MMVIRTDCCPRRTVVKRVGVFSCRVMVVSICVVAAAAVTGAGAEEGDLVVCSSGGTRTFCSADTGRGVTLVRELGEQSCAGNWGHDEAGIWVDQGCRAEFRLGGTEEQEPSLTDSLFGVLAEALVGSSGGDSASPEDAQGTDLVCESRDNRRAFCKADTSGGVRLAKQLSRASCKGNWGYDESGIWVVNGCRATFELLPTPVSPPSKPADPVGPTKPAGQRMVQVICQSQDGRRVYCPVKNSGDVRLTHRIGDESCRDHWGYDEGGVWVDGGCRAVFSVSALETVKPTSPEQPTGPIAPVGPITVTCGSEGGGRKLCPVDTSGGVRLTRQLSRASCVGHWGYGKSGIWVDDGCRAEFEIEPVESSKPTAPVTPVSPAAPVTLRCESKGDRRQVCPAEIAGEVRLVRQLSRASCVGHWGYDEKGIWVDDGCRAEFEVELAVPRKPARPEVVDPWYKVVCESADGRKAFCSAHTSGGVRLVKQLGSKQCVGHWGYDDSGIWVDRGCRAEFRLGGEAPPADEGFAVLPSNVVRCESRDGRHTRCPADISEGVRLIRRLSEKPCVGHWGYGEDSIWVEDGCGADFELGG